MLCLLAKCSEDNWLYFVVEIAILCRGLCRAEVSLAVVDAEGSPGVTLGPEPVIHCALRSWRVKQKYMKSILVQL